MYKGKIHIGHFEFHCSLIFVKKTYFIPLMFDMNLISSNKKVLCTLNTD